MTELSKEKKAAYLESRGWERYPDESWLLPGVIQFDGDDALDRALVYQLKADKAARQAEERE
jgi:hypothetical protein